MAADRIKVLNSFEEKRIEEIEVFDEESFSMSSYSDSSTDSDSSRSDSGSEKVEAKPQKKGDLTSKGLLYLKKQLQSLGPERKSIGTLMCFCIRHSRSARMILEVLISSIMSSSAPLHRKMNR